jgi:hypothetical protein
MQKRCFAGTVRAQQGHHATACDAQFGQIQDGSAVVYLLQFPGGIEGHSA